MVITYRQPLTPQDPTLVYLYWICTLYSSKRGLGPTEQFNVTTSEVLPRITLDDFETGQLEWTIEICELEHSQLITKDIMRGRLRDLKKQHGDGLLCPHISFDDGQLMTPFDHRHCVCFREATMESPGGRDTSRNHNACCARRRRPETTAVFMHPSGWSELLHHFCSGRCWSGCQWILIGRWVFLRRIHKLSSLGSFWLFPTSRGPSFVRIRPDMVTKVAKDFIYLLDTDTYVSMQSLSKTKNAVQPERLLKLSELQNELDCRSSVSLETWI